MNEFTRKAAELADSYAMWFYQYTTFGTPDKRERSEAARSALLAHIEGGEQKPGWKLVPVELTNAMMDAAEAFSDDWPRTNWKWVWEAMLAATPTEEASK